MIPVLTKGKFMSRRRKVVDAHLHFFDHMQNRHEFLEVEDSMFRALIGDYSLLPRTYGFADYVADAPDVEIEGLVWHEFLSTDPVKEVLWAQRLAESLSVPVALVGLVDFLSPREDDGNLRPLPQRGRGARTPWVG
jgi:predicted TIM-barrel fold metal-dependent hydrolase